ncbi:MAG TPA: cytochrome c biogenesis protein CcsA [Candidatus Dormibacteraeota bacterium]|nr:cytochrome c biogenesis protein CcsA [Candidatus Dormibacteraeota bacterium]
MELLFFALSLGLYLVAATAFIAHITSGRALAHRVALVALTAAFALDTFAVVLRLHSVGLGALGTFHDQLSLLAWLIVGLYLGLQWRAPLAVLGALVTPLAFLLTLSSYIVFSGADRLPAELDTAWLPAHVAPAFLGYAIFALASCVSLVYLLQERQLKAKRRGRFRLPSLETLDDLNYRCVAWGFALFTIGIVTGSLLAKAAWGTFWSWEPVQVLSVLAWLLYAVLLQARSIGWRGRRAATLTLVGFALLVVSLISLNIGLPHGRSFG